MSQRGDDKTRSIGDLEREGVLRIATPAAGTVFASRYEIVERLGGGGTGEVFRALDRERGRHVALKILFPRPDLGPRAHDRIHREWRLLAEIEHPGIVRVHDCGEDGQSVYLAMECLDGETLGQRLERRPPPSLDESLAIMRQVASALAAAHARGIVHRDIKPTNIFLDRSHDGSCPRVVLIDFGLARGVGESRVTATGQFLGTPEYVSPEQAKGSSEITPAADVYSAGAVFWELLSGEPPFCSDSVVEVLASHLERPLPRLRPALAGVDAWLRDLVAWMLEKEPGERPRDGSALLELIESHRRRGWWRRQRQRPRRAIVGIAAALALAALAFGVVLTPQRLAQSGLREVTLESVAGIGLREWTPVRRVRGLLPLRAGAGPISDHLVLLGRSPREGEEGGERALLWRLSPLSGTFSELPLVGRRGVVSPEELYISSLGERLVGVSLQHLPIAPSADSDAILARLLASRGSINRFLWFAPDGELFLVFDHEGPLSAAPLVVPAGAGSDRNLLLLAGTNARLGRRSIVVGVMPRGRAWKKRTVVAPPYTQGLGTDRKPSFYTLLSEPQVESVALADGSLRLEWPHRDAIEIDPLTGIPLQAELRGGLSAEAWVDERSELELLLVRAHGNDAEGSDRGLAEECESFAARAVASAHAGAALFEAARLWWHLGDADRAISAASRGTELEPRFNGHHRVLHGLLCRVGRWEDAERQLARWALIDRGMNELTRQRFVQGLANGRVDEVRALARGPDPRSTRNAFNEVYLPLLLALHDADLDGARAVLESAGPARSHPVIATIEALSHLVGPEPSPAEAATILDGLGPLPASYDLPVEFLRATAEAMSEDAALSAGEIEVLIERLPAGLEANTTWYLRSWLWAFASRLAEKGGHRDLAARYATAARESPAAGPYLDLILEPFPQR